MEEHAGSRQATVDQSSSKLHSAGLDLRELRHHLLQAKTESVRLRGKIKSASSDSLKQALDMSDPSSSHTEYDKDRRSDASSSSPTAPSRAPPTLKETMAMSGVGSQSPTLPSGTAAGQPPGEQAGASVGSSEWSYDPDGWSASAESAGVPPDEGGSIRSSSASPRAGDSGQDGRVPAQPPRVSMGYPVGVGTGQPRAVSARMPMLRIRPLGQATETSAGSSSQVSGVAGLPASTPTSEAAGSTGGESDISEPPAVDRSGDARESPPPYGGRDGTATDSPLPPPPLAAPPHLGSARIGSGSSTQKKQRGASGGALLRPLSDGLASSPTGRPGGPGAGAARARSRVRRREDGSIALVVTPTKRSEGASGASLPASPGAGSSQTPSRMAGLPHGSSRAPASLVQAEPASPSSVAGTSTDGTDSDAGDSDVVASRLAQSVLAEAKRALGASDHAKRIDERQARTSRLQRQVRSQQQDRQDRAGSSRASSGLAASGHVSYAEASRRSQEAVDRALQQAESVFSMRVAELLKREREKRKVTAKHAAKRGRDAAAEVQDKMERLEEVRKAKLNARAAEMDGRIRAAEERAEARIRRISERVQSEAKRAREAVQRAKAAEDKSGELEEKLRKTARDLESSLHREKAARNKYLALKGKAPKSVDESASETSSPAASAPSSPAAEASGVERVDLAAMEALREQLRYVRRDLERADADMVALREQQSDEKREWVGQVEAAYTLASEAQTGLELQQTACHALEQQVAELTEAASRKDEEYQRAERQGDADVAKLLEDLAASNAAQEALRAQAEQQKQDIEKLSLDGKVQADARDVESQRLRDRAEASEALAVRLESRMDKLRADLASAEDQLNAEKNKVKRLEESVSAAETRVKEARQRAEAAPSDADVEDTVHKAVTEALEKARSEFQETRDQTVDAAVSEAVENAVAEEKARGETKLREAMEKAHDDAVTLGEQWYSYHEKSSKHSKEYLEKAVSAAREEEKAAAKKLLEEAEEAKDKAVEERVAAARSEYEGVMRGWEKDTDKWRQEIISSCEKSLEVARKEVVRVREEREYHKKAAASAKYEMYAVQDKAESTNKELAAAQTELGESRAQLQALRQMATEETHLKYKYQKEVSYLSARVSALQYQIQSSAPNAAPGTVGNSVVAPGSESDTRAWYATGNDVLEGQSGSTSSEVNSAAAAVFSGAALGESGDATRRPPTHKGPHMSKQPARVDVQGLAGSGPPIQPSPAAQAAEAARRHAKSIGFERKEDDRKAPGSPADDSPAEQDSVDSMPTPTTPKQVPPQPKPVSSGSSVASADRLQRRPPAPGSKEVSPASSEGPHRPSPPGFVRSGSTAPSAQQRPGGGSSHGTAEHVAASAGAPQSTQTDAAISRGTFSPPSSRMFRQTRHQQQGRSPKQPRPAGAHAWQPANSSPANVEEKPLAPGPAEPKAPGSPPGAGVPMGLRATPPQPLRKSGTGSEGKRESSPAGYAPQLSQPAITAIQRMTVAQLKRLLDRAKVPHADCVEKAELQARLVTTVERGAAKNFMDGGSQSVSGRSSRRSSRASSVSSPGLRTPDSARRARGNGLPVDEAVRAMAQHAAAAQAYLRKKVQDERSPSPVQHSPAHDARSRAHDARSTAHDARTRAQSAAAEAAAKLQERYASPPNPHGPAAARRVDADKVSPSQVDASAALDNWLPAKTAEGQVYYYHRVSRAVRWEKPDPDMARKVEARIIGEKLRHKRRHAERVQEIKDTADRAKQEEATKDTLREDIELRVAAWARGKTIGSMLYALPQVITWGDHTASIELDARSSAGAIKKAYLRAVRVVHPDKVATAPLQQRLEAQRVFAVLYGAFKAHEDGELPPTFKPKGGAAGSRSQAGGVGRRHTTRGSYQGFAAAAAAARSGSRTRRHTASASAAYAAFAERSAASGADPPYHRGAGAGGTYGQYSARVPPSFAGAFGRSGSRGSDSGVPGSRASFSGAGYKGYGSAPSGGSAWKGATERFATYWHVG